MRQVLNERSRTFFALLNEGFKNEVKNYRMQVAITLVPHMDEDERQTFINSLQLPEDILSDILESENVSSISEIKEIFEGEDDGNGTRTTDIQPTAQ